MDNRYIAAVAYIWLIVIGALGIGITSSGGIIVICLACGPMLNNVLAGVSIILGIAGLVAQGMAARRTA